MQARSPFLLDPPNSTVDDIQSGKRGGGGGGSSGNDSPEGHKMQRKKKTESRPQKKTSNTWEFLNSLRIGLSWGSICNNDGKRKREKIERRETSTSSTFYGFEFHGRASHWKKEEELDAVPAVRRYLQGGIDISKEEEKEGKAGIGEREKLLMGFCGCCCCCCCCCCCGQRRRESKNFQMEEVSEEWENRRKKLWSGGKMPSPSPS